MYIVRVCCYMKNMCDVKRSCIVIILAQQVTYHVTLCKNESSETKHWILPHKLYLDLVTCFAIKIVCFDDYLFQNGNVDSKSWCEIFSVIIWCLWCLVNVFQSLKTSNSSHTECHQCHQIENMWYLDNHDVKINFDKKSFFSA